MIRCCSGGRVGRKICNLKSEICNHFGFIEKGGEVYAKT
jgi:hypothetical protein